MNIPPNPLENTGALQPMARSGTLGLLLDFDGTVSEIAPTPEQAVLSKAVTASLQGLSESLKLVAMISGRSVRELREKVGLEGLVYVGNHGAEVLEGDVLSIAPGLGGYPERIRWALDRLRARVQTPGLIWTNKHYSASVHYRLAKDPDKARRTLLNAVGSEGDMEGLEVFWGKRVMEIRASVGVHKGHAVRKLVKERRLGSAMVLGDDVTDVDALKGLKELGEETGVDGAGIAVLHDDSPADLLRWSDYTLRGVGEVETFLAWLLSASS